MIGDFALGGSARTFVARMEGVKGGVDDVGGRLSIVDGVRCKRGARSEWNVSWIFDREARRMSPSEDDKRSHAHSSEMRVE